MKESHKEIIKQICDFLGEDIDAPLCKEVADHLTMCPTCRVYFDTVKKTVFLYREVEHVEKLPDSVETRLFKVLKLDALKKKK